MASGITVPIASIGTTHHFILPPTANRGITQNSAFPPSTIMSGNGNTPHPFPFITHASAPRLGQPAMVRGFGHARLANAKHDIAMSLTRGSGVIARFLCEMKLEIAKMGDRLDDVIKAEEDQIRHSEHLQDFFRWDEVIQSESTVSMPDTQMGGQNPPDDGDDSSNYHPAAAILEESHALRQKVRNYCRTVECVLHRGQAWTGHECPEAEVFRPDGITPGPWVLDQSHPSTFLDELREEKKQWETLWQGCWIAWERFLDLHGRIMTLANVWKIGVNQAETAERQ